MPQVCFLSLGLGEGGVVPPLAWVWGRRGDQLMLKAGGGGGLESGWVLVGSWRASKIMGACPHKMGARAPILRAPKIIGARALILWEVW